MPALILLTGCGRAVNSAVEKNIREQAPFILGSAREYRVHVTGSARRADVTIDADDLSLPNSLLLDHLHLALRGVQANARTQRLQQIREANFTVTVGVNSLDEFFAGEEPDGETLEKTQIALHDGLATLSGQRVTNGSAGSFQIEGPVRILDAGQIVLDPERRHLVGLTPGDAVSAFLIRRFESALSLSTLPFPVHLVHAEASNGRLVLSGRADTAAILERAQGAAP